MFDSSQCGCEVKTLTQLKSDNTNSVFRTRALDVAVHLSVIHVFTPGKPIRTKWDQTNSRWIFPH